MGLESGALYYPPDDSGTFLVLQAGHIVPPSVWAMFCAAAYELRLEPHDLDDPGGVVMRNPPGGGTGVTYWRAYSSSGVHRWRKVAAAGGGAGTGVNGGDWDWSGTTYYTALRHETVVSDSPGSNQNDYSPAGIETAAVLEIDPSAAIDLTGITAQGQGRVLTLYNHSTTHAVTLKNDATSTAANRFYTPNASDWILGPREAVTVYYSAGRSRWIVLGVA